MAIQRYLYSATIGTFLQGSTEEVIGSLARRAEFSLEREQERAWEAQIKILKDSLVNLDGYIYFEYDIPRMGRRIDTLLLVNSILFVVEFKIGQSEYESSAIDQVWDYSLDLHNFHETSHKLIIVPILVCTEARRSYLELCQKSPGDLVLTPIRAKACDLRLVIDNAISLFGVRQLDISDWESGKYQPTPNIIEAARYLYNNHSVQDISRSDASAINLTKTTTAISNIITTSKDNGRKAICFVTGVPGAGKTLVGLNIAISHIDKYSELYSVFLSGNGPLVAVLREALARDRYNRQKSERSRKVTKGNVLSEVKMFIQNVHNFRDECLKDPRPPFEHVAIFDEAQRAWNMEQTSLFMRRKKNRSNFYLSEPEYLISCLDRHKDWAVVVCLVGGGQEINTGEAGISEWLKAIKRSYKHWKVYVSPGLTDTEYSAESIIMELSEGQDICFEKDLHLGVSMRSFRSENVSYFVKCILDLDSERAKSTIKNILERYPIVITRDIELAKQWLRNKARGSERYGIVVSSQAERLRPQAIHVKAPVDPVHWFLDPKTDTRSSYYLEDVATEFDIQGLELDYSCVVWDADFRYSLSGWQHYSFCGDRWRNIVKAERKTYQKNAYRVLLTRARQGMVIVVPEGDHSDPTRDPSFYDPTYEYLRSIKIPEL